MSDDILSMYGPESPQPQYPSAKSGGVTEAKDLPYDPPVGPKGMNHKGVDLGGTNHGCCGTQGKY